ncbi:MAG: glycosyltransferase family 2 protein, partial [Candidatus Latescibacterota bacterium]
MAKISFVILTWNSEKTIENCIQSITRICRSQNLEYEVRIVDNGSIDNTADIILRNAASAPVELIRLPKNLGTTRTRNRALRNCTGEVICIMDSDAALLEGDLRALTDMLLGDPSIGILAPKLFFSDGAIQYSVRRFPSVFEKLSRIPSIIFKLPLPAGDVYAGFP